MTALDKGETIKIGGSTNLYLRGWCILLSADFPAAGLCCGFKKSVSADSFCRECDCRRSDDAYPCPNSFLEENSELPQEHLLREKEEWELQFAKFQSLPPGERAAYLAEIGVNTFTEHAFVRVPHFNLCQMVPYDFMHVELEGSLKMHLAAMLYFFLRKRPGWRFSLEALNARIRAFAWPN
eukprot:6221817-Prymnesium_polylepis.1